MQSTNITQFFLANYCGFRGSRRRSRWLQMCWCCWRGSFHSCWKVLHVVAPIAKTEWAEGVGIVEVVSEFWWRRLEWPKVVVGDTHVLLSCGFLWLQLYKLVMLVVGCDGQRFKVGDLQSWVDGGWLVVFSWFWSDQKTFLIRIKYTTIFKYHWCYGPRRIIHLSYIFCKCIGYIAI